MTRGALRIFVAAFATNAALLVLQTVIFQLLPWDSSAFGKVSVTIRVGFCAADVALLVAFVKLVGDARFRGLGVMGALHASFAIVASCIGLAASAMGSDAHALRSLDDALGGAEPFASLGAALLALLALGAASATRRPAFAIAVWTSAAVSLGFRIARVASPGARSLSSAWLSWTNEVARPLVLLAFALLLLRALKTAPANAPIEAEKGPYRVAGVGAAREPMPDAPDATAAAQLRSAAGGATLYSAIILARLATAFVSTIIVVFTVLARNSSSSDGLIVLAIVPLFGIVTAIAMVAALARLSALPRASGARGLLYAAIVAVSVVILADVSVLIEVATTKPASSFYGSTRSLSEMLVFEWPLTMFFWGVALLFVGTALGRVGEKLMAPAIVARARWVQGFVIASGAAQLGFLFANLGLLQSSRWDYSRSPAGGFACAGIALFAVGVTVVVIVLQVLLASNARRALLAHADRAPE